MRGAAAQAGMCYDGSQVEDSLLLPPRPNRVEL